MRRPQIHGFHLIGRLIDVYRQLQLRDGEDADAAVLRKDRFFRQSKGVVGDGGVLLPDVFRCDAGVLRGVRGCPPRFIDHLDRARAVDLFLRHCFKVCFGRRRNGVLRCLQLIWLRGNFIGAAGQPDRRAEQQSHGKLLFHLHASSNSSAATAPTFSLQP